MIMTLRMFTEGGCFFKIIHQYKKFMNKDYFQILCLYLKKITFSFIYYTLNFAIKCCFSTLAIEESKL